MRNGVKGYKVFNNDWTCTPNGSFKQYVCPGVFEEDVDLDICHKGMHFCENALDCFNYYNFDSKNRVAEVVAYGKIRKERDKSCTDKLEIIREISWQELLTIVNTGRDCTGFGNAGNCNTGDRNTGNYNTGNCNTGDRNTGNYNTGDWNTGDCNTGNWNTGDCNTGNWNTGNCNTGNWNTGNYNTGNWNTGDWNRSSHSTGCFNTKEQKIMLFNKPSNMIYNDWLRSDARYLLNQMSKSVVEWVHEKDMTDEEKAMHPDYKTTGCYLKVLDESECGQLWWDHLSRSDKDIIKAIPNFDEAIFYECTGIRVD